MPYLIRIMPIAESDLEAIFLYNRAENSPVAERWFARLTLAIDALASFPQRHPRTPEDPALRHLLFGKRPHIYRIIYSVDINGQRVDILHVRHGARSAFTEADLTQPAPLEP